MVVEKQAKDLKVGWKQGANPKIVIEWVGIEGTQIVVRWKNTESGKKYNNSYHFRQLVEIFFED
jgi:hypothetical protein